VAAVLIVMGALGLVADKNEAEKKLIVTMVYLFLFFFNVGWGPTVWVVCSELSTGPNRCKLMSVSTASNWFWN
jgi:SP family sugar:H+ symporter-like MFS transporter